MRLVGGKPVIYIQTPKALKNVDVTLSLVKSWSFSAIYPPAPVTSSPELDTVNWIVDVTSDGTIRDKKTDIDAAYLYWEAMCDIPFTCDFILAD